MSGLGWFIVGVVVGFYIGGLVATLLVANHKEPRDG